MLDRLVEPGPRATESAVIRLLETDAQPSFQILEHRRENRSLAGVGVPMGDLGERFGIQRIVREP